MSKALVLNATFEPLAVVTARRALMLILSDKAELLHRTDNEFHSPKATFPEPSVVRLAYYVKVPYKTRVALNKRAVFLRDHNTCQYCGNPAESLDHVMPRSRGGTHTWDNVVASCKSCNSYKENRLPGEVGFVLRNSPSFPKGNMWLLVNHGIARQEWELYLHGK
ncbi:MAG: HNH endonuclease [Actinobacteria bacterium]|jgi:5-methylcytosine-specific restriction endonuclease McrA|nr:HNH endonuclease [Actinomycetota bacterium]MCL6104613.1 HNH endonuclease [Actinomycetota bacterium]